MSDASSANPTGFAKPNSSAGDYNAQSFLVEQLMAKAWTSTLVQVVNVTNSGTDDPVGFVDIKPLVNMTDGAGKPTPHDIIYGVPYLRLQGGTNAIILDPAVNDIGTALFAHSDISSVKTNKAASNPGSKRRNDAADAMYFGAFLGAKPAQYLMFSANGVSIVSTKDWTVTATGNGTITVPNFTVAASSLITLQSPTVKTSAVFQAGNGATGTFTSKEGLTITVKSGIVTSIG